MAPGVWMDGVGGWEERKEWVRVWLGPVGCTAPPPQATHLPAWASSSRARRRLPAFLRLSRCFSLAVTCKRGDRKWLAGSSLTHDTGWAPRVRATCMPPSPTPQHIADHGDRADRVSTRESLGDVPAAWGASRGSLRRACVPPVGTFELEHTAGE